ncbi:hypothetical protein [Paenibacillus arenilitoris]|uniref:Uncharacterized protein n=1 Tax=Paenibacillus arenilitoris TaxID=2772299 RepID=A0A927H9C2_9BACL|nr:hypothetical protein [Paenibacillus arenilitoris]MBD2872583.1 hypothetical protein [Paenibacillus arenilitoris]
MSKQTPASQQGSFIFNVEVLVEGSHNAVALEKLIHALNNGDFADYRIVSGIRLGEQIDDRKAKAASRESLTLPPLERARQAASAAAKSAPPSPSAPSEASGFEKIKELMKNNTLIRLIVNKGLGIKLSIPCRIINMSEADSLITVYHVDEKQVYTFRLNEIEDFSA